MNYPEELGPDQIAHYGEIFASGDGERLLRLWEEAYDWSAAGGHPPRPIDFGTFGRAISKAKVHFALACVKVLPDRFFDLKRPLRCRDNEEPEKEILERLNKASLLAPLGAVPGVQELLSALVEHWHPLVEAMVRRGWDPTYAAPPGADRRRTSMLFRLAGIRGTTPILRRILPHMGGAEAMRRYSDSRCNGVSDTQVTQTLLHRAVGAQDLDMVRFLVREVGVDPNTVDSLGRTALMANLWVLSSASEGGSVARNREMARELIAMGLNIEHVDEQGSTALVYAVQTANPQAVQFLIDAGANPLVRAAKGQALLEIAEEDGSEEVARILRALDLGQMLAGAMGNEDGPAAPRASTGPAL